MNDEKIQQIISQIRSLADELEQCCSSEITEEDGMDEGESQSSSQPAPRESGGGSKMAMAMAAMKKK